MSDSKPKYRGLGRGLSALIPDANLSDKTDFQTIPIEQIYPNPHQPRKEFKDSELNELAESIKRNGILQPLLVQPSDKGYNLIAGERRWRAAKIAGLSEVPVRIITDIQESALIELSLVENLQREDLNPVELAEGYRLLQKQFHLTQEEIAQCVGKDRATISNTIRLLELPENILNSLRRGEISAGHAKVILSLENNAQKSALFKRIISNHLSVRQAEELAKNLGKIISPKRESKKQDHSPIIEDYRHRLMRHLGTQVHITKRGSKGNIRIDFYSEEDLERILSIIINSNI